MNLIVITLDKEWTSKALRHFVFDKYGRILSLYYALNGSSRQIITKVIQLDTLEPIGRESERVENMQYFGALETVIS